MKIFSDSGEGERRASRGRGPPEVPSREAFVQVFDFMSYYADSDANKLLDALPKPTPDRAWCEEIKRIEERKQYMEKELANTDKERAQIMTEGEELDAKAYSELEDLNSRLSALKEEIETRKRKLEEEKRDRQATYRAFDLKRARIQERMRENDVRGRSNLKKIKERHFRGLFERFSQIFRTECDVEVNFTYEDHMQITELGIDTNGSNYPKQRLPLHRSQSNSPEISAPPDQELEERIEEIRETGNLGKGGIGERERVSPKATGAAREEPLLDASQVNVRVDEKALSPRSSKTEKEVSRPSKGPLYHSAPPAALSCPKSPKPKYAEKKPRSCLKELHTSGMGIGVRGKGPVHECAEIGEIGENKQRTTGGKGPLFSKGSDSPTPLMKLLKQPVRWAHYPYHLLENSEDEDEFGAFGENAGITRKKVFSDSSSSDSSESASSSSDESSSVSELSDKVYLDATKSVLEKARLAGTTNSSPTRQEIVELLRKKKQPKRRSDIPYKRRKRSSKPGAEKNKRPLTKEEKLTIGHWNTLPKYNHGILIDGVTCLWCNGRVYDEPYEPAVYTGGPDEIVVPWFPTLHETEGEHWLWGKMSKRACKCRCYEGHTRAECYYIDKNGHGCRHGFGFFPTEDMNECYKKLIGEIGEIEESGTTIDEMMMMRQQLYGNYRDSIRDYHKYQNETNPTQTDLRMTLILTYSMRNNNFRKQSQQPRCPLCGYVDTRGDRAYTLCRFCRGSGYIKARWNIWRDLVLLREQAIKKEEDDEAWSVIGFRVFLGEAQTKQKNRLAEREKQKAAQPAGTPKNK